MYSAYKLNKQGDNKFEENSTRKYVLCVSTANRSGLFTDLKAENLLLDVDMKSGL